MLKQKDKDQLKATYGIDIDALITAIKADTETDFAVATDITVLKTTDLEARDTNKMTEGKRLGETEGEKKGKDLAAKAFRKKFNLEDSIGNDVDKVVEAVNAKLNKGDAGLQEQITLLQKDKETLATQNQALQQQAKAATFDSQLIATFPANRDGSLTDAERLAILKMNLSFEETDGKVTVKRNGETLRVKDSQNLMPMKDAVESFFTEKKWSGEAGNGGHQGGRGGGDNAPAGGSAAGIKTATKFAEKWKAENPGKNELSSEYIDALNKQAKEVADFDMYS
jgi:hypothetical protein